MAANVENVLELGLREAAETVWARKVIVEAVGVDPSRLPFGLAVSVVRSHAKAVGRAEGIAFALELLGIDQEVRAEVLLDTALREIGGQVWDRARVEQIPGLAVDALLLAVPLEASWSEAAGTAGRAARLLQPLNPTPNPKGPTHGQAL